jgi:hypothetical protein
MQIKKNKIKNQAKRRMHISNETLASISEFNEIIGTCQQNLHCINYVVFFMIAELILAFFTFVLVLTTCYCCYCTNQWLEQRSFDRTNQFSLSTDSEVFNGIYTVPPPSYESQINRERRI